MDFTLKYTKDIQGSYLKDIQKSLPFRDKNFKDGKPDDEALKKACSEFETIFIESMIKAMRKTVPEDGLFSGGFGEEIFQEMFDQEIARQMADCKGLGIANTLYNQLNTKNISKSLNSKAKFAD